MKWKYLFICNSAVVSETVSSNKRNKTNQESIYKIYDYKRFDKRHEKYQRDVKIYNLNIKRQHYGNNRKRPIDKLMATKHNREN